MDKLTYSAEFVKSSKEMGECPDSHLPEYAFIGRSNVGKSSLINMLTRRNKLAKVSSTPGKTQLINHFLINEKWHLVDLPGYGWAQVSKTAKAEWKIMIEKYLIHRSNLVVVFVLIDSRLDPQKIDLEFMQWLGEAGIPFVMVFTKMDKLKKVKKKSNIESYNKKMKEVWEELPQQFLSSSKEDVGRKEILNYIQELNTSIGK